MTQFAGRTHSGCYRRENEDAIGWDVDQKLWFVADGMGGHVAGAVASSVVKDTLLKLASTTALLDAVLQAHHAVVSEVARHPEYEGMGSTLVSARFADSTCSVVWVGDSRAYLWRGGTLRRLTRDHSVAEILREQQDLSEEEIRSNPNGHVVTQTLGLGEPDPSVIETALLKGDWVLLCSDGLTDELTDPAIIEVLGNTQSPDEAADALLAGALGHGGRDNVSIVIIAYDGPASESRGRRLNATRLILVSILGGAGAALACAAVWRYLFGQR